MSAATRVRRLHGPDVDRWRALWRAYLAFYRADVPDHVSDLTFQRLRDGERGMVGLVAVDEADTAIGFAHLVIHATTWSASSCVHLEDLYVDPSHRGGPAARMLFAAVYAHATEQGVQRVYWHTQQYNGAARSLYDTVGKPTSFVVYEHNIG